MLFKNMIRQITHSMGRFLAIFAIVALGVGFFVGLRVSKDAMVKTGSDYFEELKLFDFRLVSTLGLTEDDVKAVSELSEVESAVGSVSADVMYIEENGANGVLHMHSILEGMNQPDMEQGRMPESADECVIDSKYYADGMLGTYIELSKDNSEDTFDTFAYDKYKVVGVASSPYYANFERGSSSLGGVSGFCYILPEGFTIDYYTEIFVRTKEHYEVYSDECDEYNEKCEAIIKPVLEERGNIRFESLNAEAFEKIHDAEAELADGKKELDDKKAEVYQELVDAEKKIADGEKELSDAIAKFEEGRAQIEDAKKQLEGGKLLIEDSRVKLADGRNQIEEYKARLEEGRVQLEEAKAQLEDGRAQIEEARKQLEVGKAEIEAGRGQLETAKAQFEEARVGGQFSGVTGGADAAAALAEQEQLLAMQEKMLELQEQLLMAKEQELKEQEQLFNAKVQEFDEQEKLLAAKEQELISQEQLLAKKEQEVSENEKLLAEKEQELSDAQEEIDKGRAELESGRNELEENRAKAEKEFADAEIKIADGQKEIDEGYEKLADLKAPTVFVLGRSTNIGYASLENDTDIVAGVAKVFPFFFFIVASLVCITTMTRMVDEQRVQNGILKALGYSDFVIVGQYLFYAGTASVLGCIVGFLVGSKFMPLALWEVYHIMYSINRPIVYLLDWQLFAFCAVLYLLATLGTTWLAASGDLREAAAELIRPKAPAAGKRVFLERIGFIWQRLKFLHKVSIRNILRYKKRMFMMIIGVGGCTALLLTGYGIRDSIQPILDYQFGEIHVYDMSVSFMEAVDSEAQQEFVQNNKNVIGDIEFVRSESMDLVTNGSSDSVSMVVADELRNNLVSLHNGDKEYGWPGLNETIIDYRLADANNISIGDTIEFRNADYEILKLKVVGIFDNYIRDYAYISSETYLAQMGHEVEKNTAYVNAADGVAASEAESHILGESLVAAVSVTANQAEMVGNMLSSLDLIVLIVLVCAGALAFIVIYNLTNISINERIREIATIKVLGFHEGEAAAYVFRENLVLTVISSIVGLPMGVLLHRYVMAQIKINAMYFGHKILPMSFVWSVIITFLFAVVVDFFMYFRLKKINMAESLKAVD